MKQLRKQVKYIQGQGLDKVTAKVGGEAFTQVQIAEVNDQECFDFPLEELGEHELQEVNLSHLLPSQFVEPNSKVDQSPAIPKVDPSPTKTATVRKSKSPGGEEEIEYSALWDTQCQI